MNQEKKITLLEAQEIFAKSSFNGIWELLEKSKRTPEDNENLLLGAYASLYHWKQVGTAVNLQRGYWMISRVYQVLGEAQQALDWARKCQQVTENYPAGMEDFDRAFAREGLARAYAMVDELEKAREQYDLAAELGKLIEDPDDKRIFMKDFENGNWYQLSPE